MQKFIDPLNNQICYSQELENALHITNGKELSVVITKPSMIIVIENRGHLYHYRFVREGETILLKSKRGKHCWQVSECIRNPDSNLFRELLVVGKVIFNLLED